MFKAVRGNFYSSKMNSFFEADAEMQSQHNNPIVFILFFGSEHSGKTETLKRMK